MFGRDTVEPDNSSFVIMRHLGRVVVMRGEMAMSDRMRMVCVRLVNVFRRDES